MKKLHYIAIVATGMLAMTGACRNEEQLDVNLSNYDSFTPGPVDNWIETSLTDPYNIDVVYRYRRDMHEQDRNVSPPDQARVIPQMSIVLEGFLKLYEKVGGSTFIKTYTPKQFVLFGSGNYRPDGVVIAGTADAGRRINLYGLNGLDETNPSSVLGNLGVVHHEFVHILNQIRFIPPSFEEISRGDYFSNWNSPDNPESASRAVGFISQYARQNIGEDFAETMSYLVAYGQIAFDNYARNSGQLGYERLKRKETVVRDYLMQNFEIDLTELQLEFEKIMSNRYNSTAFEFRNALSRNALVEIGINNTASYIAEYGQSAAFQTNVYNVTTSRFQSSGYAFGGFSLRYASADKLTLRAAFGTFAGDYDFDVTFVNNQYRFTLSDPAGTGTTYDNGDIAWVKNAVQPMLDYMVNNRFKAEWFPREKSAKSYLKFGGFSTVNDPANYFYGSITYR